MSSPSQTGALVSVIIPVFNAEQYIAETLASVSRQTHADLEVLVADDASTDATRDRVLAFARRDSRVRLVASSDSVRSGRPSVPRNRALQVAIGEFVAFLDADDLWTAFKLEDQISVMLGRRDLLLVYSMLRSFGKGARFAGSPFGLKPWPTRAAVDADRLEEANTVPCSSVLARRTVLVDLGGFDEDPQLAAVEDYDLWMRISRRGPIGFIPRIHGYYRVHASGISRDSGAQARRAEYLAKKRALTRFTFREFQRRPLPLTLVRNTLDLAMTAMLRAREAWDRTRNRRVPLRTAALRRPGPRST